MFFVRRGRAVNQAVTHLCSDQVEIVPHHSMRGWWLTIVWTAGAPFRIGMPWLWLQRSLARVVLGPVYTAVEESRRLPSVRRWMMRQRPLIRRLKAANARYAALSNQRWARIYAGTLVSLHERERAGLLPPPIRLRLPPGLDEQTAAEASCLGIRPGMPIVTVHVRESGYRASNRLRQREWDASRNSDIASYRKAFVALVERGYAVVRLGDATMTPIDVPGVVDLATSPARSQARELWCTLRSDFLIGCDSGPSWLAMLVGVPLLTVNAVHFRDLSRPTDRLLCKLARERATGRVLSVSEMLTETYLRSGFKDGRFQPIDNSGSDIRRAALDMIDVVRGLEERSSWQRKFNRRLRDLRRRSDLNWSALDGVAIMGRAQGTLSRSFARKYFENRTSAGVADSGRRASVGRSGP